MKDQKAQYNEIWDDLVNFRDLILALLTCSSLMAIFYFIAPKTAPYPLFFGLGGALLGFIISSLWIKPKRIVKNSKDNN